MDITSSGINRERELAQRKAKIAKAVEVIDEYSISQDFRSIPTPYLNDGVWMMDFTFGLIEGRKIFTVKGVDPNECREKAADVMEKLMEMIDLSIDLKLGICGA